MGMPWLPLPMVIFGPYATSGGDVTAVSPRDNDPVAQLQQFRPTHRFFVGIDSDGCVFDSMELKQKECFCPVFIKHWGLQSVSRYAREVWEFVNLYSMHRGCNRFLALVTALDLLRERLGASHPHMSWPDLAPLRAWIARETRLGQPALAEELARNDDPILRRAFEWSQGVNDAVAAMGTAVAPFPHVRPVLDALTGCADIMVVSQTPIEAITAEWRHNGIETYPALIAGQEYGTKQEHLLHGAKGKYPDAHILMIGDAPGDLRAAQENGVLFFPICPGDEQRSWEELYNAGLERFTSNTYAGPYQNELIDRFTSMLPQRPPWS